MIAWLLDIFWSLDSVAFLPCGTSSWCSLLICVFLAFDSDHFVASRFAHCITPSFYDVSESSHGASGAPRHIVFSDGRESHLSVFSSCYYQVAQSPRSLEVISGFFSCGPVVVSATTRSDSTMYLHGRWNLFYEPRLLSSSSFWLLLSDFLLLGGRAFVHFGSLPDQFPFFLFLPGPLFR